MEANRCFMIAGRLRTRVGSCHVVKFIAQLQVVLLRLC